MDETTLQHLIGHEQALVQDSPGEWQIGKVTHNVNEFKVKSQIFYLNSL